MSFSEPLRAKWRGLLTEQEQSGLSGAAFCRERNLSIKSFGYWRKRLSEKSAANSQWLAVTADPSPVHGVLARHSRTLTLQIGIVSVDIASGFDRELLRDVVRALEMR